MSDNRTLIPGVDDIGSTSDGSDNRRKRLIAILAALIVVIVILIGVIVIVSQCGGDGGEGGDEGLFATADATETVVTPSYYVGDSQPPKPTTFNPPADSRFKDPVILAETTIDTKCMLQSAWSNQGDDMDCDAYMEVTEALSEQTRQNGTLGESTMIDIQYNGEPMSMECRSMPPNYDCRSESGVQIIVGNLDGSGPRNS